MFDRRPRSVSSIAVLDHLFGRCFRSPSRSPFSITATINLLTQCWKFFFRLFGEKTVAPPTRRQRSSADEGLTSRELLEFMKERNKQFMSVMEKVKNKLVPTGPRLEPRRRFGNQTRVVPKCTYPMGVFCKRISADCVCVVELRLSIQGTQFTLSILSKTSTTAWYRPIHTCSSSYVPGIFRPAF